MDLDLEQQLTAALERRASGLPVPPTDLPGLRSRARSIRRRRVAAGSVAGAAVVALVVPVAWGLGGLRGATEPPVATQPPSPSPTVTCSSTGVAKPAAPTDLPAPVVRTWQRLVDAAAACDAAAVQALAGKQTALSIGGDATPDLPQLEEQGQGRLGLLLKVLATTPALGQEGELKTYGWPAIAVRVPWQDPSAAERTELSTFLTHPEIESYVSGQMYYGWRVGIQADGTWSYFVAGD